MAPISIIIVISVINNYETENILTWLELNTSSLVSTNKSKWKLLNGGNQKLHGQLYWKIEIRGEVIV